jgi:UDP-N-acetylmuramyl tripeptide synthase
VLKVDTTGHFVNGERKSTLDDSKNTWGLVPSVAPGRYLYEFALNPDLEKNGVAVLESSLGCSSPSGMGYRYHEVGVFLNVYEDHLGTSGRLQTKQHIADAKQFIFERLYPEDSYAVFNADDELVCQKLNVFDGQTTHKFMVPFGIAFEYFDAAAHIANGGVLLTVNANREIVLRDSTGDTVLADLRAMPWTFDGMFQPSVWNAMAAIGALYGHFHGSLPANFREVFEAVRLDSYGGRLTLLHNKIGVTILADYAHEKVSLSHVGDLARTQLKKDGKVIGIVRLAHDRTDTLMQETGRTIATHYDQLIVYDKIDGYYRLAKGGIRYPQVVGRTSQILTDAIQQVNPHVERIVREDLALERAAEMAKPGDVVVHIVNDDIKRSIDLIKEKFNAEFV